MEGTQKWTYVRVNVGIYVLWNDVLVCCVVVGMLVLGWSAVGVFGVMLEVKLLYRKGSF